MANENLSIIAYDKPVNNTGGKTYKVDEYKVMFNPASFSINNKVDYNTEQGKGKEGSEPIFEKIPPREFSLEFTIDGTGLYSDKIEVADNIKHFMEVTGSVQGKIHRPHYLAVTWGNFFIRCILVSSTINYSVFDRSGKPIRAKIIASFIERTDLEGKAKEQQLSSADLTHYKTLLEGDKLYLIGYEVYEDPSIYLEIAKVNKLKNFRNLKPGTKLILPPFEN